MISLGFPCFVLVPICNMVDMNLETPLLKGAENIFDFMSF